MASMPKHHRNDFKWALLFLAPNLIGFLVFVAGPVVFSLVMALTNWDLLRREPFAFIGLDNFKQMLFGIEAPRFWKFLTNTLYLMLGLPFAIGGSLVFALLLSEPMHFGRRGVRPLVFLVLAGPIAGGAVICFATGQPAAGLTLAVIGGCGIVGVLFGHIGFRTLFYLPFFTSGVALYILWKNLLNPEFGPINEGIRAGTDGLQAFGAVTPSWLAETLAAALLVIGALLIARTFARRAERGWGFVFRRTLWLAALFGGAAIVVDLIPMLVGFDVTPPTWLTSTKNLLGLDPETVVPESWAIAKRNFGLGARDGLILMSIWVAIGGNNMLLYLAGLANVPVELHEAAVVDGAGRWARFRYVTWPQLAPTTFFILIMSLIGGLQGGFEQARVMVEQRAAETAVTLGYYIYLEGFQEFRLGYASAVAWMMFLLIFVVTLVNWRFGHRHVNV